MVLLITDARKFRLIAPDFRRFRAGIFAPAVVGPHGGCDRVRSQPVAQVIRSF
jgi:hypothetical protein